MTEMHSSNTTRRNSSNNPFHSEAIDNTRKWSSSQYPVMGDSGTPSTIIVFQCIARSECAAETHPTQQCRTTTNSRKEARTQNAYHDPLSNKTKHVAYEKLFVRTVPYRVSLNFTDNTDACACNAPLLVRQNEAVRRKLGVSAAKNKATRVDLYVRSVLYRYTVIPVFRRCGRSALQPLRRAQLFTWGVVYIQRGCSGRCEDRPDIHSIYTGRASPSTPRTEEPTE